MWETILLYLWSCCHCAFPKVNIEDPYCFSRRRVGDACPPCNENINKFLEPAWHLHLYLSCVCWTGLFCMRPCPKVTWDHIGDDFQPILGAAGNSGCPWALVSQVSPQLDTGRRICSCYKGPPEIIHGHWNWWILCAILWTFLEGVRRLRSNYVFTVTSWL